MTRYLRVHGGFHGARCWERVIPLLEQQGHTTRAIAARAREAGWDHATIDTGHDAILSDPEGLASRLVSAAT